MRKQNHNYCLVPMSIAGFAKHNNIKVTLVVGRLQHSKHSKATSLRDHGCIIFLNSLHQSPVSSLPCLDFGIQLPAASNIKTVLTENWRFMYVYLLSSPNHFRMSCATLLHDLTSKDHYKCWCQKMTDITGLRLLSNNFCQITGFLQSISCILGCGIPLSTSPRCSIQPFCFCPSWSHSHLLVRQKHCCGFGWFDHIMFSIIYWSIQNVPIGIPMTLPAGLQHTSTWAHLS